MSAKKAKADHRRKWAQTAAFLRAFMDEARALFARLAPAHYTRLPAARRPCATCAFRAWTDTDPEYRDGRESTAWNLMQALERDDAFYCHDGWTQDPTTREYAPPPEGERKLCRRVGRDLRLPRGQARHAPRRAAHAPRRHVDPGGCLPPTLTTPP